MGHVVSGSGIAPNPGEAQSVVEWPTPKLVALLAYDHTIGDSSQDFLM